MAKAVPTVLITWPQLEPPGWAAPGEPPLFAPVEQRSGIAAFGTHIYSQAGCAAWVRDCPRWLVPGALVLC